MEMDKDTEIIEIMGIPSDASRDRRHESRRKVLHVDAEEPPAEEIQLTSPIVTLVVGSNKTKFHAADHILCKVPFFQAALQGHFREASEKLVTMPDDDPEVVSKMVEVLVRGDYSPPVIAEEGVPTPEIRLQCKLFHAQVYILGEKYACDELCEKATQHLQSSPITGMDKVLEYLVLVYEMTGSESKLRLASINGPHLWSAEKTRKLVAGLWRADGGNLTAHRKDGTLGEVCRRCPELARDLLALLACGGA